MKRKQVRQEQFLGKFNFDPGKRGFLGVEIEWFLTQVGKPDQVVPLAPLFLNGMGKAWGYELSACQVEYHTKPSREAPLRDLQRGVKAGKERATQVRLELGGYELASESMPLDVYPHDKRYAKIAAKLPEHVLRAACRVAGTHIHVGVKSIEEAIAVHNRLTAQLQLFLNMGDHSQGERVRLYKVMAPNCVGPYYENPKHFYRVAKEQGFLANPRDCYHLVRINPVGTVEVRAFGSTLNVDEIALWCQSVKERAK
ncbi:MAG: hypothetical protein ABH814_02250 [bacterium]